jgi:hypothetical protein
MVISEDQIREVVASLGETLGDLDTNNQVGGDNVVENANITVVSGSTATKGTNTTSRNGGGFELASEMYKYRYKL